MYSVEEICPDLSWQQELSDAFTRLDDLLDFLSIDIKNLTEHERACKSFPLLVTRSYAERIKKGDISDPLLRQVLPLPAELQQHSNFSNDPVGDSTATVLPGLIHKYHGRALIVTTPACAIHCRYCFRRTFPYADNSAHRSHFEHILSHLKSNPDIEEVILSGGDPLTLSDQRFKEVITKISAIKHIRRIRLHTRLPIVLPSRVTDFLLDTLVKISQPIIIVIHANHPNEITSEVTQALIKLKHPQITLLNQSVLLKGINDQADILVKLSHRLFDAQVLPYYLHLLDRVNGSMHFDLPQHEALTIYQHIQQKLPGYLVPRLAREEEAMPNKTLINQ